MTDRRDTESFETRFGDRVRVYTDQATERRIDALAISRAAMSSQHGTGWLPRRLGAGFPRRGIAGAGWAVALVAVVLIGLAGIAILGRPSEADIGPQPTPSPNPSTSGPVPEVLRHSWQRPYAVTPGLDQWGSGFLSLASDLMDLGPAPGDPASTSTLAAAEPDVLVATATVETQGCAIGDTGAYRWSLDGKATIMTLTAISPDACAAREESLAGPWVRSDLPGSGGGALPPGTYLTSAFDPFDEPGLSGQLSYTVSEGWKVKEDQPATFVLHRLPDAPSSQPPTDMFVALLTQARMATDFPEGAICGEYEIGDAPGVGRGIDDIVAAIRARPGMVSMPPVDVSLGGFDGQMVDLHLGPSWTGGCQGPDGPFAGTPILVGASGFTLDMRSGHPLRLILLDLGDELTLSIAISSVDPSQPFDFEKQVAEVIPILDSFEFRAR